MLTNSERHAFQSWLLRVNSRCMEIDGRTLADIQAELESAGHLPEPGLMHSLCNRWRKGCSVSRAAATVCLQRETFA